MLPVTEEQVAQFGMTWRLGLFIGLMLFIIWDLARKSQAGRLGTFILFFVLAGNADEQRWLIAPVVSGIGQFVSATTAVLPETVPDPSG